MELENDNPFSAEDISKTQKNKIANLIYNRVYDYDFMMIIDLDKANILCGYICKNKY